MNFSHLLDDNTELVKKYYDLFVKWHKKINLMHIANYQQFIDKHVFDAWQACPLLASSQHIVDLGCGAGIPGLALAIVCPDIRFTLIDSRQKRISFCNHTIASLNLKNVHCIWARAESSECQKQIGLADTLVSRATWQLDDFLTIAYHYIDTMCGQVIAWKGPNWSVELIERPYDKQCWSLDQVSDYTLLSGEHRSLLQFHLISKK